jgi:hypothetical protein
MRAHGFRGGELVAQPALQCVGVHLRRGRDARPLDHRQQRPHHACQQRMTVGISRAEMRLDRRHADRLQPRAGEDLPQAWTERRLFTSPRRPARAVAWATASGARSRPTTSPLEPTTSAATNDISPAPEPSPDAGQPSSGPDQSNGKCLLDRPGQLHLKPNASTSSASAVAHVAICPGPTSAPGAL